MAAAITLSGCQTAPPSPWLPTVVRLICSWTIVTKGGGDGSGGTTGGIAALIETLVALVSLVAVSAASCGSGGADGVGGAASGAAGRLIGWRVALPRRSRGERLPSAASTNASMARGGDGAAVASCTLPRRPWSSSVPKAARPALLCSACAACLAAAALAAELVAAAVTRAAAVVAAAAAAAAAANSALARRAKPPSTCSRLGCSILQASARPSSSEADPGAAAVVLPSKGGDGGGGGWCAALTALHSPLSFAPTPSPTLSKWRRSLCDVHTPAIMPASLWLPTTTRAPPMITASPSVATRHRKKPLSCLCPAPNSAPKRVYLRADDDSVFGAPPRGCHCCHMPTYPRRCTSHTATAAAPASGTATASPPCIAHTCSRRPSLSLHGPERSGPRPTARGEPSGAPSISPAHRASGVRHATDVSEARAALTVAAPKRHSTAASASTPKPPPTRVSCVAPRAGPAGFGSCAEIVAGGRHWKSAPLLPYGSATARGEKDPRERWRKMAPVPFRPGCGSSHSTPRTADA